MQPWCRLEQRSIAHILWVIVPIGCGSSNDGPTTVATTTDGASSSNADPDGDASSSAGTPGESSSAAESTGGAASCQASADCSDDAYCDFANESCGASGSVGTCTPRPSACEPVERPVCGCDDALYASSCEAAAAGIDLAFLGACEVPNGAFACGPSFCILGEEYCAVTAGLAPTAACVELPPACQPPHCNCMVECCGCTGPSCCEDHCSSDGEALTFTCPGE